MHVVRGFDKYALDACSGSAICETGEAAREFVRRPNARGQAGLRDSTPCFVWRATIAPPRI